MKNHILEVSASAAPNTMRSTSDSMSSTGSNSIQRVKSIPISRADKKRGSLTLKSITDTGDESEKISDAAGESFSTRVIKALVIRKKPDWYHAENLRGKLVRFLHSGSVGHFMNVLLVVDIILLIVGIQMEVYYLESKIGDFSLACEHHAESLEHYGDHELHDQEKNLVAASIAILSVFLLEIFLSILAEGLVFFHSPLHWLDMIVISVSLFFEVEGDASAAEALILVRCWRFLRLIHGVFDILEDTSGEEGHKKEGENDTTLEDGNGTVMEVSVDDDKVQSKSKAYLDGPEVEPMKDKIPTNV